MTFPQIFIDGRHIGGCDELYELEHAGKLDALLAAHGVA
jgi:glutaredoxin 3